MIQYKLNIGDVVISDSPATYTCFGLGSCIGLFIQDRLTGLSGGAHIFLPASDTLSTDKNKFYAAGEAIKNILDRFKERGSNLNSLRAKVVGGANVLGASLQTGPQNTASVIEHLVASKIFIAAKDVGGKVCRTAHFKSDTGELIVKVPATNEFKIY